MALAWSHHTNHLYLFVTLLWMPAAIRCSPSQVTVWLREEINSTRNYNRLGFQAKTKNNYLSFCSSNIWTWSDYCQQLSFRMWLLIRLSRRQLSTPQIKWKITDSLLPWIKDLRLFCFQEEKITKAILFNIFGE